MNSLRNATLMAGDEATDAADAAPPPSPEAAVVISVRALEAGAAAEGGCKVVADEQQQKPVVGTAAAAAAGAPVVVDMDEDKLVCRICHLSPDRHGAGPELILLGCGCKGDLGTAHRDCAEAWFKLKGNRCCEVCGASVKNIKGQEGGSFMEEWQEGRVLNDDSIANDGNANPPERVGCLRGTPFCNFLMACMVTGLTTADDPGELLAGLLKGPLLSLEVETHLHNQNYHTDTNGDPIASKLQACPFLKQE